MKTANRYTQGFYKPKNPQKYKGNINNIVYRSSWELRLLVYFDDHPDILRYASEEYWFVIPYRSPIDNRMHRYFPGFWYESRDINGKIQQYIVEVKPSQQCVPPPRLKNGKIDKRSMQKAMTYAINRAKWNAAEEYCKKHNYQFKIITEKDLP